MATSRVIEVREWETDSFHRRVLQLESQGFVARLESYRITPEMNPENGIIIHLHSMEMYKPDSAG
jgi:hypothetical protein